MAHAPGAQRPGGQQGPAVGLMLVRITLGAFLFFVGMNKASWFLDSTPLATQLAEWSSQANPVNRWYLDRVMPGVPIFARLIPAAEIVGGLALVLGFWTRLSAALCLVMVLNVQLASAAMFKYSYLTDPTGLPLIGALLGLMIGGGRLPLSIRR